MSRHSKNNTSQSIFTYGEKQKLKGEYGTKEQRINQDSIKKFEMCTICNSTFVEPVCCTQGHIFCRSCAIEYLVKQKKLIAQLKDRSDADLKKRQEQKELKKLQQNAKKIIQFEKYDNFENITARKTFTQQVSTNKTTEKLDPKQAKPIGVYELTTQKQKFVKSSFWATENTPNIQQQKRKEEIDETVKCPAAGNHKLTLKKLRPLIVKQMGEQFCCGICNKQIRRQKIGSYKCGHVICFGCKSDKCQICGKKEGWIDVESSASSFAQHNKAQVKTYTHAFYM